MKSHEAVISSAPKQPAIRSRKCGRDIMPAAMPGLALTVIRPITFTAPKARTVPVVFIRAPQPVLAD